MFFMFHIYIFFIMNESRALRTHTRACTYICTYIYLYMCVYARARIYIYIYIHVFRTHISCTLRKYESPSRRACSGEYSFEYGRARDRYRYFRYFSTAKRRDSQIQRVPRKTTRIATIFASHGVTCVCRNARINGHIHEQTALEVLSGCFA